MTPKKQVSPVIRISQGERDASARATHLEAVTRKFLVTTNERKYMSTKTNFKRIALVAVAALGLGVLSSVPSQATATGLSVTITDGSAPASTVTMLGSSVDSRTSAKINIKAVVDANDSITVQLLETAKPTGGTSNIVMYYHDSNTSTQTGVVVDTLSATNSTNALRGTAASSALTQAVATPAAIAGTVPASNGADMVRISTTGNAKRIDLNIGAQLDSATSVRPAGTYTFLVIVKAYNAGQAGTEAPATTVQATLNIVVSALAAVSTTATSTYGFAFLSSSTTSIGTGTSTTSDEVISALATTGTTRGYFYVGVRNASNGATTARESLTATVTGAGLVCLDDGSACGKSLGPVSTTAGDYEFELRGDGSGGLSTIKVTGSVTGASYTKSLTYYAAAAKTLTATVLTPVLAVSTNDSAIAVTAVDAAGANWGGTAYIYASSAADATAVGGSATTPVACVFRSANNTHYCPITATTAGTGKFKVIDASTVALATATSNEVTVTSKVATPATVKISFNKANYAPGEIGLILITALDAAGAALPASTISNALASGGISSDVQLLYNGAAVAGLDDTTATLAATSGTTRVAGSEALIFTAPMGGGKITLTAKGGSGLPLAGQVALTASATVTDNGAAALAAVNALATTVASLRTLITTLTNLVLKIQKKVKA
jgi:hypothetical protein